MTRDQKIEWAEKASGEQLIEQLRRAVINISSDHIGSQIKGEEDYEIFKAELLRRIG